jgi:DNA-binding beta-propeller fold protein YncE
MHTGKVVHTIMLEGLPELLATQDGLLYVKYQGQDGWRVKCDLRPLDRKHSCYYVPKGDSLKVYRHGVYEHGKPKRLQTIKPDILERIFLGEAWSKTLMPVRSNGQIFVALADQDRIVVVNINTNEEGDSFATGRGPSAPLLARDQIWVYCRGSGTLEVYDHDGHELASFNVGMLSAPPVFANDQIYVVREGTLLVSFGLDLKQRNSLTLAPGARRPAVSADQRYLFISSLEYGEVAIIDTNKNEVVQIIKVGEGALPSAIYDNKLYVPHVSGRISVIDISPLE